MFAVTKPIICSVKQMFAAEKQILLGKTNIFGMPAHLLAQLWEISIQIRRTVTVTKPISCLVKQMPAAETFIYVQQTIYILITQANPCACM